MICYGLFKEVANGCKIPSSRSYRCGGHFFGGDGRFASSFLHVGDDMVGGVKPPLFLCKKKPAGEGGFDELNY